MVEIKLNWHLREYEVYKDGDRIDQGYIPGYVVKGDHHFWLQILAEGY